VPELCRSARPMMVSPLPTTVAACRWRMTWPLPPSRVLRQGAVTANCRTSCIFGSPSEAWFRRQRFDETCPPWEWDVKAGASMEVAARDNGFTGKDSRRSQPPVASYRNAMRAFAG